MLKKKILTKKIFFLNFFLFQFLKNRVRQKFNAVLSLGKTALDGIPRYRRTALQEECLYKIVLLTRPIKDREAIYFKKNFNPAYYSLHNMRTYVTMKWYTVVQISQYGRTNLNKNSKDRTAGNKRQNFQGLCFNVFHLK